jgi:hypothetical protein
MPRQYTPYIPQGKSEIMDKLGSMMLSSPKFEDDSGYFPGKSIDTEFYSLNEGLRLIRNQLGEEKYLALADLSARMRKHFEADPDDKTEDGLAGRQLIHEMEDILYPKRQRTASTGLQ